MSQSLQTNTLFNQIIREEYAKALLKKRVSINEATGTLYTTSNVDPEYAKNPKHPWTGTAARGEQILRSLGAKPYSLGINDDGFELLLYINGVPSDRLQFYSDNTVYSSDNVETMGWKINGSSIQLTEKPGSKDLVGKITKSGNKNTYVIDNTKEKARLRKEKEEAAAKEYTRYEAISDKVHLVLDYAGFLPGIGDIADLINAAWYLYDGKYIDSLLSAIAIIPVIGSAIAVPLKAGFKTIGKGYTKLLGKGVTDSSALWAKMIENGIIDKHVMGEISEFSAAAAKQLQPTVVAGWLGKVPFLSPAVEKQILQHCDEFSKFMDDTASSMNRTAAGSIGGLGGIGKGAQYIEAANKYENFIGIIKAKPEFAVDLANKAAGAVYTPGRLRRFIAPFGKVLGNAPWFKTKKINAIVDSMGKTFSKQFAKDPAKISMLVTHMPNKSLVLKQLDAIAEVQIEILNKAGKLPPSLKDITWKKAFENASPTEFSDLLKTLNQSGDAGAGIAKGLQDQIVAQSVKNNNPLWVMYKSDQSNQIKTLLTKEIVSNPDAWKANFGDIRKYYDIIGSEVEDGLEAGKVMPDDEKNGFIVDAVLKKINDAYPQLSGTLGGMAKYAASNPLTKTVTRKAKELVGYDDTTGYNPNAKKGGIYTK